jgi:3-methyladenine DNA glycosylase AlkC
MNDENEHVRRLTSEGSRPLLPWGQKLQRFVDNPELTWPILEKLKSDPSQYVRKSVANHINDISKNHPEWVIKKLLEWKKSSNHTPEIDWIIKHASRTLIKKGYTKAFSLHGVSPTKIKLVSQKIGKSKINLGETLEVEIELLNQSNKKSLIIIDHEVHFLKSNGKHGVKVFKGKKVKIIPGLKTKFKLSIPMKKVTTRKYYPGVQFWNIKINGSSEKPLPFTLLT